MANISLKSPYNFSLLLISLQLICWWYHRASHILNFADHILVVPFTVFLYLLSSSSVFWPKNSFSGVILFHQDAHNVWLFLFLWYWYWGWLHGSVITFEVEKLWQSNHILPSSVLSCSSSIWREIFSSKPWVTLGYSH